MRQKSKTNSVRIGKYKFQPTKYDESGNLYCKIIKVHKYKQFTNKKCKLTLLYNFEGSYKIIFNNGWLTPKHQKLLIYFLKQYDWI